MSPRVLIGLGLLVIVALSSCKGGDDASAAQTVDTPTPADTSATFESTPLPGNLDQVVIVEDNREYVIQQLIVRDGIRPIYDSQFVSVEDAPYNSQELVMGVEINGDARAYSVNIMRRREMVNDWIGGTPVLVTW